MANHNRDQFHSISWICVLYWYSIWLYFVKLFLNHIILLKLYVVWFFCWFEYFEEVKVLAILIILYQRRVGAVESHFLVDCKCLLSWERSKAIFVMTNKVIFDNLENKSACFVIIVMDIWFINYIVLCIYLYYFYPILTIASLARTAIITFHSFNVRDHLWVQWNIVIILFVREFQG